MIKIVGPCSIESEEQIRKVVQYLVQQDVEYIRGGIWKYRSVANAFQGHPHAVSWITDLKKEYNFKFVCEVFDEEQALAYKNVIDVYQVGSRNMYNTNLLKKLGKIGKTVILKRHYCASLQEFEMHSHYLKGCPVWMCLRGQQSLHTTEQRFFPDMSDIQRLREVTNHKIIYDVSHSSCHKRYIENNLKAALCYEPDGIMIEVHPDPEHALSDPQQQLNFEEYEEMMNDTRL